MIKPGFSKKPGFCFGFVLISIFFSLLEREFVVVDLVNPWADADAYPDEIEATIKENEAA
ncbi:hypothetical protein QUA74_02710 [Microcoleus sp. LAD1_D3]|uniref:hypothetical protein n=1 Tax=Microcoleus sp. LAD1_D3 TaxID=2819365 RepID=UPI002FD3AEF4